MHVLCVNTNGSFYCPPCPTGFAGNSDEVCIGKFVVCMLTLLISWKALCGNGICESNLQENCVSCPLDCTNTTCGICGDGQCGSGEDCISCFSDCEQTCRAYIEILCIFHYFILFFSTKTVRRRLLTWKLH